MFEYPVVFVDIETTGGSYRNSRVLEVAAIRFENGEVVKEFSTLVDPGTRIPPVITSITGITQQDIIGAPGFEAIADELLEILDGAVFIAHNVRFDYSFLKQEFALIGTTFSPRLLCTVRLSRYLYSDQQGHSLEKLIARHSIPVLERHRALEDARAILYFSQLAFDHHGPVNFADALTHQLKSQSLPPHLDLNELEIIENVPGVYIFKDETHQPVYVGKSVTLKKRVLSHFQSTNPKEVRVSQGVYHVETIPTGSELAALLLESKLIKELKPLYNHMLRRVSKYAMLVKKEQDGYSNLTVVSGSVDTNTDLRSIYGVYSNRIKAKQVIIELTRTFQLCPKLMGIEKAKGACFSFSLGRCRGACTGKEDPALYNARFETALEKSKLSEWPYDGSIIVPVNEVGETVVINNWMVQRFNDEDGNQLIVDAEPNFDLDEYNILRRFIKENRSKIMVEINPDKC